jgi:acyl-CoA synthetase (AMP-forming)/AMP-acid ligase II
MIKTAGANVSPAEVQEAIRTVCGLESIAFGLPDPDRGQVVAAALVVRGGETRDADAVRAQLAPLLSSYKIPKVVRTLRDTDVPLRSSGKVDMTRLKELFTAT